MKIIKYLVSIIVITILGTYLKIPGFLNVLNVYAYAQWPSASSTVFKVNTSTLQTNGKVYTASGNIDFRATSDELWSPAFDNTDMRYGYYSVCVSSKFDITTYSSGTYSRNPKVVMTGIPCQIYNSTAYPNSVVMYMTFELNTDATPGNGGMCSGASTITCSLDNKITVYVPQAKEWTLNSYGFSPTPFEVDTNGTLINQNTTIIDQNNQILVKLNENHTYNNYASTNVPGGTDVDNINNLEETLFDNLDFSGVTNLNIGMDATTSNFIWEIVNRLRTIPGVLLMMTSALGLGLMKMILNR